MRPHAKLLCRHLLGAGRRDHAGIWDSEEIDRRHAEERKKEAELDAGLALARSRMASSGDK